MENPSEANGTTELTEAQRREVIARAQRELPDLSEKFQKAIRNLDRISAGLRPQA